MTQTLPTRDPNDTGEIPDAVTVSFTVGGHTEPLYPAVDVHDGWSPIRHQIDDTAAIPMPQSIGVHGPFSYDPGPYPPVPVPIPPDPTPAPSWTFPAAELPTVRPARPDQTAVIYRPAHLVPGMQDAGRAEEYYEPERAWFKPGRRRTPAPRWTRVVLGAGLYLLGVVSGASAMVAWVVAQ